MNRFIAWGVRCCVSLALLATVFAFLPVGDVWRSIRSADPAVWLGVLCVFVLAHGLSAMKWWLLAAREGTPLRLFVRGHFAGLFGNLCLPGVAGGDVVRCAYVMRRTEGAARIGVAGLADRLVDTVALLVLACIGSLWVGDVHPFASRLLVVSSSLLFGGLIATAAGFIVLSVRRDGAGRLGKILDAMKCLLAQPWLLLRSFGLSLIIQSVFVALNVGLGWSVDVRAHPSVWCLSWPLAKLAALVPVTLGGLGIRESALVLLMRPFGADGSSVTAASLLWQSVLMGGGLIGGAVALRPSFGVRPTEAS